MVQEGLFSMQAITAGIGILLVLWVSPAMAQKKPVQKTGRQVGAVTGTAKRKGMTGRKRPTIAF